MQIHCRVCSALIEADDINLSTQLAKCRNCHAVFDLVEHPGVRAPEDEPAIEEVAESRVLDRPPRRRLDNVPLPARWSFEDSGWDVRIQFRWFRGRVFVVGVFAAIWIGFALMALRSTWDEEGPIMLRLVPILLLLIGAFLVYRVLVAVANRTTIRAQDFDITVRHGPLPFRRGRVIARDAIDQIYSRETKYTRYYRTRPRRSHDAARARVDLEGQRFYSVVVRLKDGNDVHLIGGLETPDQALFLEQKLEKQLNLKDSPVPGEI